MITINNSPYQCAYSKNEMSFEVQSSMYYTAMRITPSIILQIDSFPISGENYIIQYTNPETLKIEQLKFVARLSYDELYEIPDGAFGGTIEEYRDVVFDKVKDSCPSNGWYTASKISTNQILLQANEPSVKLVPEFITNQVANHIVGTVDETVIDPPIRDGYLMRRVIYFEKEYLSGSFEIVSDLKVVLDEGAMGRVDVSYTLDAEIESFFDQVPLPFSKPDSYISENLKRYYVEFSEAWTDEPDVLSTKSEIQFVYWGGVSTDDQYTADPVYLNSATESDFLTWWPSGKKLHLEQKDWISWMNHSDAQNIRVKVSIHTNVGISVSSIHPTLLNQWESIVFAVGYTQLDLESIVPGEHINKWSVEIQDSLNITISEVFTYYPIRNQCLQKTILYWNSFGVFESFATRGEWQETMDVSTEIADRSAAFNLSNLKPRSFVFNSMHQNSFSALTGILDNESALHLQAMLNSTIAYLEDGTRWIPVIMNTGSKPVLVLNQFLQQIELEILKANDSDRASFYDVIPDIEMVVDCGIVAFSMDHNDLDLTTFGDMEVRKGGVLIDTLTYNPAESRYDVLVPIVIDGDYIVTVLIDNYSLNKQFSYRQPVIIAKTRATGNVGFSLKGVDPANTIEIDWGDGLGYQTENYGNVGTLIPHNYPQVGVKTIRFRKPCFEEILLFTVTAFELDGMLFDKFTDLEGLGASNSIEGNLYLSSLENLVSITLSDQQIYSVQVGFQKELLSLTLDDLPGFNSNALDELFIELWTYRKFYSSPATVVLQNMVTPSSLVNDIINGTGLYAGEGLVSDYSWTVTII